MTLSGNYTHVDKLPKKLNCVFVFVELFEQNYVVGAKNVKNMLILKNITS